MVPTKKLTCDIITPEHQCLTLSSQDDTAIGHQHIKGQSKTHSCQTVVDWNDDETIPDPDETRSCESDVLRDGEFVGRTREIFETGDDEGPFGCWR